MRSLGKLRRLQQASGPRRTFTVLAIDHRGPLRRRLTQEGDGADVDGALREVKVDIVRELAAACTAVLLDPEAGLAACLNAGALPGSTGLLVALDTGSTGDPAVLRTGLVEGWSAERIARVGAAGVKLLVYYHPKAPSAREVEERVSAVASACEAAEIPLFLEPLSFDPTDPARELPSPERREVVVETARRLGKLGVDILKAEFPVHPNRETSEAVWGEACRELTQACPVPWVLLSAGVSGDTFLRQAAVACDAGASGVIAGRAIWNEAVTTRAATRLEALRGLGRERLATLREICESRARPWDFTTA